MSFLVLWVSCSISFSRVLSILAASLTAALSVRTFILLLHCV